VQREYWANGFLAYYKVKNIPNFAIGLPIIALSFAAVADYMRRAPARAIASLGTAEARDPLSSYHSAAVFVHIVYLAALSLFGLCFMYIQCTTRFICASSPAVFWYTARTPGRTAAMVTYSLAFTAIGSVLFSNFYPWT
jgi:phosphatidylinositol glycan class V